MDRGGFEPIKGINLNNFGVQTGLVGSEPILLQEQDSNSQLNHKAPAEFKISSVGFSSSASSSWVSIGSLVDLKLFRPPSKAAKSCLAYLT